MKIAILLYHGITLLDAIGPYEVLSNLPTTEPSVTGSLWVSGSTTTGQSGFLAVFNP